MKTVVILFGEMGCGKTYTSGANKFFEEIKPVFPKGMERKYNILMENYID